MIESLINSFIHFYSTTNNKHANPRPSYIYIYFHHTTHKILRVVESNNFMCVMAIILYKFENWLDSENEYFSY